MRAARAVGVDPVFTTGTLSDCDPGTVDGVYLFNPFGENMTSTDSRLDDSVELGEDRYWRDVGLTERFLEALPEGARVVTYCGWGGSMPRAFELVLRERRGGVIDLWTKGASERREATSRSFAP